MYLLKKRKKIIELKQIEITLIKKKLSGNNILKTSKRRRNCQRRRIDEKGYVVIDNILLTSSSLFLRWFSFRNHFHSVFSLFLNILSFTALYLLQYFAL